MKLLFKPLGFIVFFLLSAFVFLPKINMYYLLEEVLLKNRIVITNENTNSGLFDLKVNNADIVYKKQSLAHVESLNFRSFIFFNNIHIYKIKLTNEKIKKIPKKIENIEFSHSVLNPLYINIQSNGRFGNLKGHIHLAQKKLVLTLKASGFMKKEYPQILKKMNHKKGEYTYEQQL